MDYYAQHMHNCDLVNLEDMLQNGTVITGTLIEKPHSFSTACNIATQIIAQVASNQYGGQSITPRAPGAVRAGLPRENPPGGAEVETGELGVSPDEAQISKMVERRLREEIKPRRADHPVSGRDFDDDERSGAVRHRVYVSERGEKRAAKSATSP